MPADPKPVYLIAGGRSSMRRGPDPLFQEALQLAGIARPAVAYVGAASGDNAMFRAMIARRLRNAGAGEVKLAPLCGLRADPRRAARVIESSHIVFVSGGDVEAGMVVLEENGMSDFLRDQYRQGKPFIGLSAGSIMLAKYWVTWNDAADDSRAELFPCLGIAEVCCDTHDEADGWEELQELTRLSPPGLVSYGITSRAALLACPNRSVRAVGGEVHCFTRKGETVVQIESLVPASP